MPANPVLASKDPSILLDRIRQTFPDITWGKFKFIDVGWDHEVIQLDDKFIFRFPNSIEYVSSLHDEVRLLAFLKDHIQAQIPSYSYVPEDSSFGGYAMLKGKELSLDYFANLSQAHQHKVAKDIADFLTDLHSLDTAAMEQFNIQSESDFAGYGDIVAEADKYIKPNLSDNDYQTVNKMLTAIIPLLEYPQPARLIHGDIAPKHLIWNDVTERVGFIDFSDRIISDPAYDFAELYTYSESFVDKVYELYKGLDKNEQFLKRAKAYMKAIGVHSLANAYRSDKITVEEAMQLVRIGIPLQIGSME